jgi:hypothetical protein
LQQKSEKSMIARPTIPEIPLDWKFGQPCLVVDYWSYDNQPGAVMSLPKEMQNVGECFLQPTINNAPPIGGR